MKTEIQPEKGNFTEDSELNKNFNSIWERQFYWKLLKIQPEKGYFTEDSELNEN